MEFHIYDHTAKLPIGLPVTKLNQSIDQWLKYPKRQNLGMTERVNISSASG